MVASIGGSRTLEGGLEGGGQRARDEDAGQAGIYAPLRRARRRGGWFAGGGFASLREPRATVPWHRRCRDLEMSSTCRCCTGHGLGAKLDGVW